ncbi:hypothetical protein F1559_001730 [Cyanidiococcus yangmingshanensis]|uniref:DUF1517 domain-containing protein n=1 Tax=Cyanidiococcus yangmingshanensis TaxID=2690220 RepID=A0A7J7IEW2_9RHOD|nr:hypothetical protein F1559_001730 [Cyanidiococcus yangmingshanensis]
MAFVYTFACKTWKAVSFETRHVSCGCQSLRKRQRAGSWLARKTVKDVSRTRTALALRAGSEVPQERPLQKSLLKGASVLVALLAAFSPLLGDPTEALAAQGGGRVGGSSFRAPVTRSAPSRSYSGPSGGVGGYYYSPAPIFPVTPFFFGPVVVPFGFTGFGTFLFAAAFLAFATRALGSARDWMASFSEAEAVFNRESFAERGKLERETLSNVAGRVDVRRRNNSELDPTDMRISEYIVVTLIVAASGRIPSLPKQIRNSGDVEATLRALSSIPRESLQGVEVIWSPQSLEDVLTEREMLTDHPELVRI